MKKGKGILCAAMALIAALSGVACGNTESNTPPQSELKSDTRNLSPQEYSIANLTAIDDYGRTVEIAEPGTGDKYVGLFYFAWLGNQGMTGIYDVDKLEKENPAALYDPQDATGKSPAFQFHFTNEPLYGYYSMNDEWVITRHIELFTMAGIDYILFDYTNSVQYNSVAETVLKVCRKFKSQGWKVPGVGFYTNSGSASVVRSLYKTFYKGGEYDDLWFRFNNDPRPVIVGVSTANGGATDQTDASEFLPTDSEEYKYFNFYESQWPSSTTRNEERGLAWMQWGDPVPLNNKFASVSVAQHSQKSVFFSEMLNTTSRGYDGADNVEEDWKKGANFDWQWRTAQTYADKGFVENIFVTGWNEWTAIKYPSSQYHDSDNKWAGIPEGPSQVTGKEIWLVDGYNAEHSRDVEMSKAAGDGFYIQMVRGTRKFKMGEANRYKMRTKTFSDLSNFSAWDNVFVEYADFAGDAIARDGENAARVAHSYIDNSNRNDIKTIKVAHDENNVYLYVETVDDITAYNGTDTNWLNLFISAGDATTSFAGFNYVVNRKPKADGKTSVEKCSANGYNWSDAGEAEYVCAGNKIVYKIPLSAIGLKPDNVQFSFKVADNVQKEDDILDYYVSGDCAPIGRFGYAYGK